MSDYSGSHLSPVKPNRIMLPPLQHRFRNLHIQSAPPPAIPPIHDSPKSPIGESLSPVGTSDISYNCMDYSSSENQIEINNNITSFKSTVQDYVPSYHRTESNLPTYRTIEVPPKRRCTRYELKYQDSILPFDHLDLESRVLLAPLPSIQKIPQMADSFQKCLSDTCLNTLNISIGINTDTIDQLKENSSTENTHAQMSSVGADKGDDDTSESSRCCTWSPLSNATSISTPTTSHLKLSPINESRSYDSELECTCRPVDCQQSSETLNTSVLRLDLPPDSEAESEFFMSYDENTFRKLSKESSPLESDWGITETIEYKHPDEETAALQFTNLTYSANIEEENIDAISEMIDESIYVVDDATYTVILSSERKEEIKTKTDVALLETPKKITIEDLVESIEEEKKVTELEVDYSEFLKNEESDNFSVIVEKMKEIIPTINAQEFSRVQQVQKLPRSPKHKPPDSPVIKETSKPAGYFDDSYWDQCYITQQKGLKTKHLDKDMPLKRIEGPGAHGDFCRLQNIESQHTNVAFYDVVTEHQRADPGCPACLHRHSVFNTHDNDSEDDSPREKSCPIFTLKFWNKLFFNK